MADWQKIKTEYITTDISYRKLAEKYGLRYATLQQRATKEGWPELRDRHRANTVSKVVSKIGDSQAQKMVRIDTITGKLLDKLEQAVDELDSGGMVDRAGLRQVTAALKDLKEIQMIKSELDRQEQEARIRKLQKEAQKEDADKEPIRVVLEGSMSEYAR